MLEGQEPGETFLRVGDPPEAAARRARAALARVPGAVGVNNHMGSRLTAERAAMDALMPVLRARGLFFLDSRTTPPARASRQPRPRACPRSGATSSST
jgi:polysaccharide deacetylase 2 family uncharacterized protein YibQ